jgi:protein TonB
MLWQVDCMNPRALDEKPPGLSRRWSRPLLASVAFHTLLLGVIVLALMQRLAPRVTTGSAAAATTLFLQKPALVSTAAPPAQAPPIAVAPTPTPPETTPAPEEGVPVLAARPKPEPVPSPKTVAVVTPSPTKKTSPHLLRAKQAVAASTTSVAPMASSYAPGEEMFAHPPYPEEARERGDAGTVKVTVAFDAGGRVAEVEITQSSGSLILDHQTATFIRANWHSAAEAGQVVCVPVRYSLENL